MSVDMFGENIDSKKSPYKDRCGDLVYESSEASKMRRAFKVRFPNEHDETFKPGEKIGIRSWLGSGLPAEALCVKEYPYFYLFRTVPTREGQEAYNFTVHKASLFTEISHVKFVTI